MRPGPLLRRVAVTAGLLLGAALASPASALAGVGSGAEGRIAFAAAPAGSYDFHVYTARPDGSGLRQLTNTPPGHSSFNTAWSPDGRTIAFDSDRTGLVQLFTMRPDGTHVRQLTHEPVLWSVNPAWSPDGRKLAFVREPAEAPGGDIYVMNADGSGERALTHDAGHNLMPAWSSDGTRIAFNSDRTGPGTSAVYQMRPDGTHVRRLTPLGLDAFGADYAPDGRHVAFSSNLDLPASASYVIRPDGSGLRQLTSPPPDSGGDAFVSYSPDGRRLVFASDRREGDADLWVMDADGTGLIDITPDPGAQLVPDWGRRRRRNPTGPRPFTRLDDTVRATADQRGRRSTKPSTSTSEP
jgi:Tol biopolymer transport system component